MNVAAATELDPALERPQAGAAPGAGDAVTFAFGDPAAECFGIARVGLSLGDDGQPRASGLGVLFAGREPVAIHAESGIAVDGPGADAVGGPGWDGVAAGGVTCSVAEPLSRWTVAFTSEQGRSGFELAFESVSVPALVPADDAVARLGGMQGYDHLCRVTGTARVRGGARRLDCLGQRGHWWGQPDWSRVASVRTVNAWFDEADGVSLVAVRPARAGDHGAEARAATLWTAPDEVTDAPAGALAIAEPRLSATYDAQGHPRRASFELFEHDEDYPRRGAGDVLCGTSLDLGHRQLDCAFFAWTMEGRSGVGRFDVLRRA